MAEKTGIAWTDSTFNPWIGCTKVGPGCDHCYAEALMDKRWHKVQWGPGGERKRTSAANWKQPLLWEREHAAFDLMHERRRRVFCASLADVFDNEAPASWRADLFALIDATPHLDWLLLTKRIGNVAPMLAGMGRELPANVWLGITVVNQEEVDRDVRKLIAVPAAVRWLSMEPLLGPVSLRWLSAFPESAPYVARHPSGSTDHLDGLRRLDWVIVGGESGFGARAIDPAWARGIRAECAEAGVPYFFKQWGGPTATAGGCKLDGTEAKAWPLMAA